MLPEIADHASERERIAIEAERETTDMKKIEYMAQFVGEEFSGIISGVTAFGIFVELDNGVEGLVHVSTMVNDYYEYREEQFAMVGERTNKAYRLGDEVEVLLVRANVEERNLDFVLKDNGAYDPLAMKNAVRGGRSKGPKPAKDKDAAPANGKGGSAKRGSRGESRQGSSKRPPRRPLDDIIANLSDTGDEKAPKKKRSHGKKNRGASGEKLPKADAPARGHSRRGREEHREHKNRGERTGNRQERRDRENGRDRDYHRVTVTGLNSAVWPDPPGYHEHRQHEEAKQEKVKTAPKHRPRPHRKTEGGTASNK
jgi:ribonuclease R